MAPFPKGRCQTEMHIVAKRDRKTAQKIRKNTLFLQKLKKVHTFSIFFENTCVK